MFVAAAAFLLFFQAADPLGEGRKALEANQLDRAAELFDKAIAQDPKDYAAHFHRALTYSLQSDDAKAIPEYEKTLELKPGLYQAELNLGISLVRQKRAADAIPHLEKAVAAKPNDAQAEWRLGQAYLAAGAPDKAETHLRSAVQSDPKNAGAALELGRALLAENKLDESAPFFRSAADANPKYRENLLQLAEAYEKAKQPENAIAIYQQFPDNPGAQERLGELLLENKKFADAIPRLEKAVADSPTAANRLALAMAYKMNKEPVKEMDQLAKAAAAEPRDYDLRMTYGRELRDQRQLAPAANQFYAAAQIKPDSKDAWNELASVLINNENYEQGLAALDKVKALGQEGPGNYFYRAITLDKLHHLKPAYLKEAIASYEQFLAADSGKNSDQEFQARQRLRILREELNKR